MPPAMLNLPGRAASVLRCIGQASESASIASGATSAGAREQRFRLSLRSAGRATRGSAFLSAPRLETLGVGRAQQGRQEAGSRALDDPARRQPVLSSHVRGGAARSVRTADEQGSGRFPTSG